MSPRTWSYCCDPCSDGCCELVDELEKHEPDWLHHGEDLARTTEE